MSIKLSSFCITSILMVSLTLTSPGAEDPPVSPEVADAKARIQLLETKLRQLELERDINALNFPKLDYTVDKTKLTYTPSDKKDIHTTIQGYRSLDKVLAEVATEIPPLESGKTSNFIYIMTTDPIKLLLPAQILSGIQQLKEAYESLITRSESLIRGDETGFSPFTLIDTLLGNGARLLSYFKNDITMTTTAVSIDPTALAFKAWYWLNKENSKNSTIRLDHIPDLTLTKESPTEKKIQEFTKLRNEKVPGLKKSLQAIVDYKAPTNPNEKPKWSTQTMEEAKGILARLATTETSFDALQKAITTPDPVGRTPLSTYRGMEDTLERLKDEKVSGYILYLPFVESGGTVRTLQGPFNIGSTSYSGGSVLGYALFRANGQIVAARVGDAIQSYQRVEDGEGYINSKKEED